MITKDKNRKGRKYATIMLALVALIVWCAGILVKHFVLRSKGIEFSFGDVFDGILDNILGILPPIIIFNFAYEYITQDYVSDEMSEQITRTLMSDPRAIARFNTQTKKVFMNATLQSMLQEEQGKMVYDMIQPYIDREFNLRKSFRYKLILSEYTKNNPIFSKDEYFKLQERLSYRKVFISRNPLKNHFKIGFFMEDNELDYALKDQAFLFREDLKIRQEELEQLIAMDVAAQRELVEDVFRLRVFVDGEKAAIERIVIDGQGILLDARVDHELEKEITAEIGFVIPVLRTNNKIFVSISEPTYSPDIELSYPEDRIKVVMMPFLNGAASSREAMHCDGSCAITIQDDWIMPMSGIAFILSETNE